MFDAFSTALSALQANSTAIDVVGNNLANLNTTGYKSEDVQFSDLMSEQLGATSSGSSSVGLGVAPVQAVMQFTQGSIQQTNGPLDAAISGNGFFMVQNSSTGQQLYTRAGNFQLGSDGTLLTANGDKVQGWTATGGAVNLANPVGAITLPVNGVSAATATTTVSLNANLNASAVVGDSNATFSAPVQVVDSQGGTHLLTFSFTKTGTNAWSYAVTVPSADLQSSGNNSIATGSLSFDSNGNLTSPASGAPVELDISGLADGAADMKVNWNLYNGTTGDLTQFAQSSGVSATQQDGIQAGQIEKVSMGNNGAIVASYSNGQTATVAQVAMASIQNPDTMVSVGNNELQTTSTTAAPAIGAAGTGGRGTITGGALEGSTVDVATQFTELMTLQRSYEASSKVVTTSDQMLQDLINLKQ